MVTDGLQRGQAGHRDGGCLLKGEGHRLQGQAPHPGQRVLCERAVARPVDVIAPLEPGHGLPHRFDRAGHAPTRVEGLGTAQPEARDPDRVRNAGHHVPRAPVHARRLHPDEDVVVAGGRHGHVGESEDVLRRRAVVVLDDRLHGPFGWSGARLDGRVGVGRGHPVSETLVTLAASSA
jgi:hypothetical protein